MLELKLDNNVHVHSHFNSRIEYKVSKLTSEQVYKHKIHAKGKREPATVLIFNNYVIQSSNQPLEKHITLG